MAVNLTKNQDEITKAWRQVVDSKDSQRWALFGYEGNTNVIKLMSTGSNGLNELVTEFNCSLIQYAFCRVLNKELAINKLILINWQGDSSPLSRKGLCASHVGDVANYFKGCTQTITIRNDDEATKEYLMEQIMKASHSRISLSDNNSNTNNTISTSNISQDKDESNRTGNNYKKSDISSFTTLDRKSFWQRQEEEEKERLIEEKKRATEKQALFEKERRMREELEAKKLAETIKERDRLIEATRRAEKRDSPSSSQPNSILSSSNVTNGDDGDDRVGRRSELIRLERNQETQSLITKGLIKNKRAIFEQAANQQQPQQRNQPSNLVRRTSGAMITQRMNSLKSLDSTASSTATSSTNNSSTNVEKLTNGLSQNVKIDSGDELNSVKGIVKKEVETIKISHNNEEQAICKVSDSSNTAFTPPKVIPPTSEDEEKTEAFIKQLKKDSGVFENGVETNICKEKADSNGNSIPNKDNNVIHQGSVEDVQISHDQYEKLGIRARAIYDYQAADTTEISFDPDDIIGYIEKVDPGWWHGTVITGKFAKETGLFPSNYVEELE